MVTSQTGLLWLVVMLTDGVTTGDILNVIGLLVAMVDVTHVKLVVITQVMLPAVVPASIYVAPVPTSAPSFFHR